MGADKARLRALSRVLLQKSMLSVVPRKVMLGDDFGDADCSINKK